MKKSLYGLKQAPRAWYAKMDSYFLSYDFVICKSNSNVYMLRTINYVMILVFYVDDILIIGSSASTISLVKYIFHDRLSMKNMGLLHFFLGLDISQYASSIKISRAKYVRDLLDIFHMTDYKSAPTPFLSGIILDDGGDTPLLDKPLCR
jgi:hypothetical protein